MKRFPCLIEGACWTVEDDGRYLLTHPARPGALRMGRLEHGLLSLLDGQTPPSEIGRNLAVLLGQPIPAAALDAVLAGLAQQGFVELPPRPQIELLPGARLECCRSGECCHLAVGPLSSLEQRRLRALPWAQHGELPPRRDPEELFREVDGEVFLQQREEDDACVFLEPAGTCQLHRVFGAEVKPAICRLYPLFTVRLDPLRLRAGVSFACPGVCQARPESRLLPEVTRAGELLWATRLTAPPPALLPPAVLAEAAAPDPQARELEQDLLSLLGAPGWTAAAALAEGARRLLAAATELLPPGRPLEDLLARLQELVRLQQQQLASSPARQRLQRFASLLAQLAARLATPAGPTTFPPLAPELDELARRAWSNYVFTRYHLFHLGQAAGLALLMLLHLLLLERLAGPAPAAGRPPTTLLAEVLAGLPSLEEVEALPGIGTIALRELSELLAGTAG